MDSIAAPPAAARPQRSSTTSRLSLNITRLKLADRITSACDGRREAAGMAEGLARRRGANGLRDRKPKACSAQIALNRCGQLSRLERGLRRPTVFRWTPERGDCLSVQTAANRSTGDALRRIIQLNCGPRGAGLAIQARLNPARRRRACRFRSADRRLNERRLHGVRPPPSPSATG
jgi:hypothetical protein